MDAKSPESITFSDDVIASSGVAFHLWRLYQHAWPVCLVFPLVALWCMSLSHRGVSLWASSRSSFLRSATPG